jgi:glycerol-3-phosphate dehydrogenase subunit C
MIEASAKGQRPTGRDAMRAAVEYCADCTSCQYLMEEECRFFAELFPLDWIRGQEPISDAMVRKLADACTYCGLCPCAEIPARLTEGKSAYVEEEGLPLSVRLLTDVPRLARLCGTLPRAYEAVQSSQQVQPLLRKIGGVHPDRAFPRFARETFFKWAARTGRTERRADGRRQAAYFAGCTVGYLFPEVGRAVVTVLERNGVPVYVPPQECCGMPFLVEGDQPHAVAKAESSVRRLLEARRADDDIVSSCPTCGFFLKVLLKENAYYSDAYQRSVAAGDDEIRIPNREGGPGSFTVLRRSTYGDALKDDGCFSSIPPLERIEVAENVLDTGDYLARLLDRGQLDTRFAPIADRIAYFPPCHQRTQDRARPYADLLELIPGLSVQVVGEDACCGMGGSVGFKADVHKASLEVGRPLFETLEKVAPDAIVTECLSCRLQFNHALQYPVLHPMEILARAYGEGESGPAPETQP